MGQHLRVRGYGLDDRGFTAPPYLRPVFGALSRNVAFAATDVDADVVHTHTWYANFGGLLIKHAYNIPLVMTTHSLEPLRPWKREQLRGGYDLSNWIEGTSLREADAVIAVSARDTRRHPACLGCPTGARPRHLQRHRHRPLSPD